MTEGETDDRALDTGGWLYVRMKEQIASALLEADGRRLSAIIEGLNEAAIDVEIATLVGRLSVRITPSGQWE